MNILAIIPAKELSIRCQGKNKRLLGNKPLISWTIEASKNSELITDIIVTTDDEDIINISKSSNVGYIRRPSELCNVGKFEAPMLRVIQHTMDNISKSYDIIILLQPTCPFRTSKSIDKCINVLIDGKFDFVMSSKFMKPLHFPIPNGAIYVGTSLNNWWSENMASVVLPEVESIDIDTEMDFLMAKTIIGDIND